jgi:ATP-dependent protease ClpP protease subunit
MKGQKLISGANEILLFGTVVPDEWIWDSDTGLFSSLMVIYALSQMSGDVTIRVNSDGGNPVEGEAIRAAFEAHQGKITVMIQGAAHSAASLMVMGADEIEMSAGSLMLIHDPSTRVFGNPADIGSALSELETMAETYATVYAMRSGKTKDEAREIMKAGLTLSAAAAVEAGFADRVTGDAPEVADLPPAEMAAQATRAVMRAASIAQAAQMKFEATGDPAGAETDGTNVAETGADDAHPDGVPNMSKPNSKTPAVPAAVADPAVPATPAANDAVMQAVAADRNRGKEIREMAAPFASMMAQGQIDVLIDEGKTVDEARVVVMAAAAANQPGRTSRVEITRDEGETKVDGMIGALMHRANPGKHKMEGPAIDYRGLRLKSLAMHLAGGAAGFNEMDTVRAGLRSTAMMGGAMGVGDFAYITTEVMGRTLKAAYQMRAQSWRALSRARSASDFRELHSVRAGGDFELKKVMENGEYHQATITDEAIGLKVARFGRDINLSFEAIINDDMGVFERLPTDFALSATTLESKIMWSLIRSNAAINGKAMFHADHGNLGAAGGIDVANVGKGRKAMWGQRPAGSKDKDAFIEVTPDLLYVPAALETAAMQFVATSVPTKAADTNPFAGTLTPVTEPRLGAEAGGSDAYWYLFSSDLPPLEHAYLDGYEAPTVQSKEGMNPDGVNMVARHIFGGAASEFRGAYRHG